MVAYQIPQLVVMKACEQGGPWMALHRQLQSIARRRAALDSEELGAIREAVRVQLWRHFGAVSLREYLERELGHGPQVAAERVRVAEALEALPALEEALCVGDLSYSAVRELTRIATPKTEHAWLDACDGKNLREIEELVAEREHGDAPTDDPKPDVRPKRVSMVLRPAARAALRELRGTIEAARGERVDDSELIEELCRGYGAAEELPRAQIAITACQSCGQARRHSAGRAIAITEAEYEEAACDARFIGSADAPGRAKSAVPPATERAVRHRDGYRCTVPGCRSARFLHVHHIIWRSRGGGHEAENLTTLCGGHHAAVHRGEIEISGVAPQIAVARAFEVPHVGDSARGADTNNPITRDAVLALTTLGFTHGFDDEGRQFDKDGNLKEWWTKDDEAKFKQKAQCMVDQYDAIEAVPGVHLNGKLTLGENLADLGGLWLAWIAWQDKAQAEHVDMAARTDGYTPEQRFWIAYAQQWCTDTRPEQLRSQAQTDPHAPDEYRTNSVLEDLPDFARSFSCKSGDKMVAAKPCRIW